MVKAGMGIGFGQRITGDADSDLMPLWPELMVDSIPVWLTAHVEPRMIPHVRLCFEHVGNSFSAL